MVLFSRLSDFGCLNYLPKLGNYSAFLHKFELDTPVYCSLTGKFATVQVFFMDSKKHFLETSENKAFDIKYRNAALHQAEKYAQQTQKALLQYLDHDLSKSRAAYIKSQTIAQLDQYLLEFEEHFKRKGGQIIWAEDTKQAQSAIKQIIQTTRESTNQPAPVAYLPSTFTQEIQLAKLLEETQTALHPAFSQPTEAGQAWPQVANFTRHSKKSSAESAETTPRATAPEVSLGICGANFLVAETGSLAFNDQTGRLGLLCHTASTLVVMSSIDALIPKLANLELFWSLWATHAQGQMISRYRTLLSGVYSESEPDLPESLYLILLDNGRSQLLADSRQRSLLNCIHCGACAQVCPVFQSIGGEPYQSAYPGPLGSITEAYYQGKPAFQHLSFASTLCGACAQVCPVEIDLPDLLRVNREQIVAAGLRPASEARAFRGWKNRVLGKKWSSFSLTKFSHFLLKLFFQKKPHHRRSSPEIPKKTFQQLWQDQEKGKKI